jgi:hypothetical protein
MRSVVQLTPPSAALPEPPLAANRFLVEAAVGSSAWNHVPMRGNAKERALWMFELFTRLEQRDRQRATNRLSSSDITA